MAAADPLPYACPMRGRVVLWAALLVVDTACFKELPTVPEGTSGTSGETSAPTSGSEEGVSSTGGVATTLTSGSSDVDDPTTGEVPAPPDEGLFACYAEFCEVWEPPSCTQGCALDAAGRCLFEQMRDRAHRRADVRVCGDTCERTAIAVRGGGTDEVERQTASELGDELADYRDLKKCVLREPEFFAGCIDTLTAECVDMMKWFKSCDDVPFVCGG